MRFTKLLLVILILSSCKKEKPEPTTPDVLSNGILVLNEGLFQQNNSSISWIDLGSNEVISDIFLNTNGRLLGDTGNDMKAYGGKIYVIVNNSNTVEVLNKRSGKSIKQVSMMNGDNGKQPRSIAFHQGKAYITCYDGYVDVLDTASLSIVQRIQVGNNPEGLAVSGNRLFVSNSGGLNYPNVDSTLSVIDLITYQEVDRVTVGKNPGGVRTDASGDVYVIARGNYGSIPSRMVKVDPVSLAIQPFSFDASSMERMGDHFLITYFNYSNNSSQVKLFNTVTETLEYDNFLSTTGMTTLYGVQYDPVRNKIYCLDAMSYTNTGYVRQYSSSGVFEKNFHVGLNPSKLIFYE
jgi:DNA-binding beta-propeller fold protein YncE